MRACRLLLLSVVAVLCAAGGAARAQQTGEPPSPVAIRFSLDRPVDGSAAPFVAAAARGFYRAENLLVTTAIGKGSADTIGRVASGISDVALADLNALIRYRDGDGAAPVKAVFVVQNLAPYAIIARKSRGVRGLGDLDGKLLGVAEGDLAARLLPALAKRGAIKLPAIKQEKIGPAVREPMLSAGQVDAMTGYSYLSAVNLRDRGIPATDLAVLRFSDYGVAAYGLAVIVNPAFAAAQPAAVAGFVRAVGFGLRDTIRHPARAIDDVLLQMDGGSRELERARLDIMLHDTVATPDAVRDGLGDIDPARFAHALDDIADDTKFRHRPALGDIFDGRFLPPATDRRIE